MHLYSWGTIPWDKIYSNAKAKSSVLVVTVTVSFSSFLRLLTVIGS